MAVGSSTAASVATTTGSSTAGLEAQLVRDKRELSACVNCATANTPEGKAAIAVVSAKIGAVEARIEAVKSASQPSAANAATDSTAANAPSQASSASASASGRPDSSTGSLVDVFA